MPKIRYENKILYAEALRRIEGVNHSSQAAKPLGPQVSQVTVPADYIVIKKCAFLAFFSEVVWHIKEVANEVMAVANKFLDISDFSPETLYKCSHSGLTKSQQQTRSQSKDNSDEEYLI